MNGQMTIFDFPEYMPQAKAKEAAAPEPEEDSCKYSKHKCKGYDNIIKNIKEKCPNLNDIGDWTPEPSPCETCFYCTNGICECYYDNGYQDKPVPDKRCQYYDGITGGIDIVKN